MYPVPTMARNGGGTIWLTGPRPFETEAVTRTEVVRPAMCGHNALFVGQIGDWTWDTVAAASGFVTPFQHSDKAGPQIASARICIWAASTPLC